MANQTQSRFLDLRLLAALERLRFTTRRRIDGAYSGRHQSRQLGGAGEFVDFREYTPGDDLRRLDWKVMARTGRTYLRMYQDETNLSCTMLVDVSRSMLFGGAPRAGGPGSKLQYAQYLTTALSHIVSQGQDQVGLAIASDKLHDFVPPGGTPEHVARVHSIIEAIRPCATTALGESIRQLFARLSRRGVLLVLSDFLCDDPEDIFSAIRLFRSRYWEVVCLHLVHPLEEKLPTGTAYRFDGLENEGHVDCSPAEISQRYQARFEAHCAMIRSMSLADGCDYRRVSTATPYVQTLAGFLVDRSG